MLPSISVSSRLLGRLSFFIFYFIFLGFLFLIHGRNIWEESFWRLSLNVCWSLALWLVFNREPPRPSLGPFSFLRGKHPLFSVSALCVCVCVCVCVCECVAVGLRTVPVSSLKLHPYVAWCPQVQSLPQNEQVEGQCL